MKKYVISLIIAALLLSVSSLNVVIAKNNNDVPTLESGNPGEQLDYFMEENDNDDPDDNPVEYWALICTDRDYLHLALNFRRLLIHKNWDEMHIMFIVTTEDSYVDGCSWLDENSDTNDFIFIFINGHGAPGYGPGVSYEGLDTQLDQINYGSTLIFIHSCYSGTAIPILQQNNRVIITSCGNTPCGSIQWSHFCGLMGAADILGNNDGDVTETELFNYIIYENEPMSNPHFQDDYSGDIIITSTDFEVEGFYDQYIIDKPDDYLEVGGDDIGITTARQSFIPTFETLTKICIKLLCVNNEEIITVRIYDINETCIAEKTTSFDLNPLIFWYTFDFPDTPVNPGELYYVELSLENPVHDVYWYGYENDIYSDGNALISYDYGDTWESSDISDFTIITYGLDLIADNTPPYIPREPQGVEFGIKNEEYVFSSYAIDPDIDQVYLLFDWGDGSESDWIGPIDSDEIISNSHIWTELGRYKIKIKAKDVHGNIGEWSDFVFIHINRPNPPLISGPTTGIIGRSYDYTFITIDPDDDNVFLCIQWGDEQNDDINDPSEPPWIGPYGSGEHVTINHTWSEEGSYTIKAKAQDINGAVSDYVTYEVYMQMTQEELNEDLNLINESFNPE